MPALPAKLEDAVLRALDAEEDSARSPEPQSTVQRRARILHVTRETLDAWREGRITTDDAVKAIDEVSPKNG